MTVPGLVHAWAVMADRFCRLDLAQCLAPAIALAEGGVPFGADMIRALGGHAKRLEAGGATDWVVMREAPSGNRVVQPELARLLRSIAAEGDDAFYRGAMADAVERAVTACGGLLSAADLAAHETDVRDPVGTAWRDGEVLAATADDPGRSPAHVPQSPGCARTGP